METCVKTFETELLKYEFIDNKIMYGFIKFKKYTQKNTIH